MDKSTWIGALSVAWAVVLVHAGGAWYKNEVGLVDLWCVHSAALVKLADIRVHCTSEQGVEIPRITLCADVA